MNINDKYCLMVKELENSPNRHLMCYGCYFVFPTPANVENEFSFIVCPNCSNRELRQHYRGKKGDPRNHPLGWPYDNWTIKCDC